MKYFNIFIRSNEHPRTINTPKMGRTYYTCIRVQGVETLRETVNELRENGEHISEIRTDMGGYVWL